MLCQNVSVHISCMIGSMFGTQSDLMSGFLSTVCKTVCPVYRSVVCPICNVGVLRPNGCMDQDDTWRGGRPRRWPHCVRWGPSSLHGKGHSSPLTFKIYRRVACVHIICIPCLSWPDGWMDQDQSWHEGRPRPWHNIVLDGHPAALP